MAVSGIESNEIDGSRWLNTRVRVRDVTYTWKIENIADRLTETLTSPPFGERDGKEWFLKLQKNDNNYLSLRLCRRITQGFRFLSIFTYSTSMV